MCFTLGRYQFDGPFASISQIDDKEGVFAVICLINDEISHLIHVEEAENIKSKIRNHISTTEWRKLCKEKLAFGVNYTPNLQKQGRNMIAREISRIYSVR